MVGERAYDVWTGHHALKSIMVTRVPGQAIPLRRRVGFMGCNLGGGLFGDIQTHLHESLVDTSTQDLDGALRNWKFIPPQECSFVCRRHRDQVFGPEPTPM